MKNCIIMPDINTNRNVYDYKTLQDENLALRIMAQKKLLLENRKKNLVHKKNGVEGKLQLDQEVVEEIIGKRLTWKLIGSYNHTKDNEVVVQKYKELKDQLVLVKRHLKDENDDLKELKSKT